MLRVMPTIYRPRRTALLPNSLRRLIRSGRPPLSAARMMEVARLSEGNHSLRRRDPFSIDKTPDAQRVSFLQCIRKQGIRQILIADWTEEAVDRRRTHRCEHRI